MGGRLALWYHIYGSLWTAKNMQTNNLISEKILSFHQLYLGNIIIILNKNNNNNKNQEVDIPRGACRSK